MDEKNRLFIALLTLFSPIWFYFPWTHTEVYTFVLLYIGLLEYYNNRKTSAVIFSSISSLQNPAASIVPFFILVFELVNLIKNRSKDNLINFIKLSCCSTIVLIPYIFYYVNYGTPSLIGKYATDTSSISFAKIMSLFFDLNFGLIIYVPILIGIIIYLICKKDKIAILSAMTVFLFAIIDSAQLNWNSGMMLINRYSYWMIPVLMFGCFEYFVKISSKKRLIVLLLTILTITPWLCYTGNKKAKYHTMFQPIAKSVLYVMPSLYTPQEEVFFEKLPYLKSVNSKWDINVSPVYNDEKIMSLKDFYSKLGLQYNDNLQISVKEYTQTGSIKNIEINNKLFKGTDVRFKLNLRSAYFTIKKVNDNVKITTKGFGHGVGMSQYGAMAMANMGYKYDDILKYYYTNVEIKKI